MEIWSIAVILAIAVVALEIVSVLRRGVGNYRGYLALLVVDAGLLGWTASEPRFSAEGAGPWPELVAGVILCGLTVFVPMFLDRLARGALAADRVGLATLFAKVKELLQPGRASSAERELYVDLGLARGGRSEEVVRRLRARLGDAEAMEEAGLHERIITVLGFGGRYREAAAHFEGHVGAQAPERHPGLAIQMVRAYGEIGELERAGQIVHRIEQAARVGDPGAQAALGQVRVLFVAFAMGRPLIDELISPEERRRLSPRMRALLDRERGGTVESGGPTPEVERFARGVVERAVAESKGVRRVVRPARATVVLLVANLAAFGLFVLLLGRFDSGHDLVRGGASLHAAVRAGEWWRLWTAMFLHGGGSVGQGVLHLGLNMYGLYLLGRVVEPLFGWPRFLVIYAVGGIAGNLLSVYNPKPEAVLSLGASGAVLGLMGALIVVLLLRKGEWAPASRRMLLQNLWVLVVVQLGFGLIVKVVDNFAHVGGLLGGSAAALLVMPGGILGKGKGARILVAVLLAALAGSAGLSVVRLARERVDETMARLPRREERIAGVRLEVPVHTRRTLPTAPEWPGEETVEDAIAAVFYAPHVLPVDGRGIEGVLRDCMARDVAAIAKAAGEKREPEPKIDLVPAPEVAGWVGRAQAEAGSERKMMYYAKLAGDRAVVVEVTYEERRAMGAEVVGEIGRVLATAGVAP